MKTTREAKKYKELYKILTDMVQEVSGVGHRIERWKEVEDYIEHLLEKEREKLVERFYAISVGLKEEGTDYGKGWHDCCLEWDLKIIKLTKLLSTLKPKENNE